VELGCPSPLATSTISRQTVANNGTYLQFTVMENKGESFQSRKQREKYTQTSNRETGFTTCQVSSIFVNTFNTDYISEFITEWNIYL